MRERGGFLRRGSAARHVAQAGDQQVAEVDQQAGGGVGRGSKRRGRMTSGGAAEHSRGAVQRVGDDHREQAAHA